MKKPTKKGILIATAGIVLVGAIVALVFVLKPKDEQNNQQEETYYTVSFETNGGEKIESQRVATGETATRPRSPEKEGYKFLGWYSDKKHTNEFDFSTKILQDTTIYAKWESTSEDAKEEKTSEGDKEQTSDTRTGQGGGSTKPSTPTPTPTPTPEPQKVYYTVSFDSNGGTAVASQTVESGKTASKPANPTKAHYNFSNWTLGGNTYNFGSAITSNINLVANWTQKSFRIVSEPVDLYSPDVKLSVTEDGKNVAFSTININGIVITGSSPYISRNELSGGPYDVKLSDGVTVKANL